MDVFHNHELIPNGNPNNWWPTFK